MADPVLRLTCRSCGERLDSLLDLGSLVPSDFLRPDQPDAEPMPMRVVVCRGCQLVQLDRTADPESLFRQYWYRSSINEVMRAELADVVEHALRVVGPVTAADRVMDIGANDGTLLSVYAQKLGNGCPMRIAFEPAHNLLMDLQHHAELTLSDFFPSTSGYRPQARSVKILSSVAMFYDLEHPRAFVEEVDRILTRDGVWIVQFQDLAQQVETCAFDNFVLEHLCYYSLETVQHLLTGFDLAIVKAERRAINGGSLRLTIRRTAYADHLHDRTTLDLYRLERVWTNPLSLEKFAWQVGERRKQIQAVVAMALDQHGTIDLYAASTKSSTLLQYCGLDHRQIRQAVERTPQKVGRVTSGTRIPIVSEETWRDDPAPLCLLGAWQFAEAFQQREAAYLQDGGKFLVPLPQTRIITGAEVAV